MSALTDAREIHDALVGALKRSTEYGSVTSTSGRTVTFRSLKELMDAESFWAARVSQLSRAAAGAPSFGRSVATFTRR